MDRLWEAVEMEESRERGHEHGGKLCVRSERKERKSENACKLEKGTEKWEKVHVIISWLPSGVTGGYLAPAARRQQIHFESIAGHNAFLIFLVVPIKHTDT